jgi:hypothetical protein
MRPTETSPPLPESELTHIPFPKTWLLENDADENPDLVKVTFPASWIDNSPEVSSDEPIVLLRVPKKMLRLDDLNEDPELITIQYPKDWFSYPTSEDLNPVPDKFKLGNIFEIDLVKLDGQIHGSRYADSKHRATSGGRER